MHAHNRHFLSFLMLAIGGLLATAQVRVAPYEEDGGLIQKRFEYFYRQRAFPLDHIPSGARLQALEQLRAIEAADAAELTVTKPKWKQVGPKPIDPAQFKDPKVEQFGGWPTDSGRVTALAVDPTNPSIVYLGAAEGGVWKTIDAGLHWIPKTDKQPSLAVGSIAIDPTNPQTIYVGTGEENFNGDAYYGAGILKSTDGGNTWTLLGGGPGGEFGTCKSGAGSLSSMFAGAYIGSIAVNPANNQILLAGVANCPSDGVYRSANGGTTWTKVLSGAPGTSVFFATGTVAYAALGDIHGNPVNGIYQSTDPKNVGLGGTWSPMNGTGSAIVPSGNSVGRVALVSAASSPTTLYAAFQSPSPFGAFNGFYKTVDGGANWFVRSNTPDFCGNGIYQNQCWYDFALAVSPVDPNVVYAGGAYDYRDSLQTTVIGSVDGGNTWAFVGASTGGGTGKVHTDTHAFGFTADGSKLFVGSDGGAWSGTPANVPNHLNWTGLNTTLATAQFYLGFALDPSNVSDGIGGTQDNGSVVFTGKAKWSNVTCGDGGFSAIDSSTNPSTYYAACSFSNKTCVKGDPNFYPCILKSTNPNSPTSWVDVSGNINFADLALFIPPMVMDPSHPSTLYYGTNRVWQTTNGGSSWAAISPQPLPSKGGVISAIGPAASDSQTIYEGASDGTVALTTNGGQKWTDRSAGLPPRYVTHIAVDPNVSTTAYVTYSGFSGFNNDNQGHIFSTSAGGSWTDISGDLPNVPVNDLVIDPIFAGTLYAATDIGVFVTTNGGSSWKTLGTGLPRVAVLSLTLHEAAGVLAAATHGRSVWTLSLNRPTEKVLYAFNWNSDGANPTGGLVRDSSGSLYGTLHNGGAYGQGTVFKLELVSGTWKETLLYTFTGGPDGRLPWAGLIIDGSGNLYGTTGYGGLYGNGCVFELAPSNGTWTETVLHSFSFSDGYLPEAGLVRDGFGNLYGTTAGGGAYGFGTVFELSPSNGAWTESILDNFIGGSDGSTPVAGLVLDKSGNLYGTTSGGGAYGWGTVFELTHSNGIWTESVLHSFSNSNGDGALPQVGLVFDSSGNLYGTTRGGGAGGTVFELKPSNGAWTESVLFYFPCGNAGCFPTGGLVFDKLGNLYGTTENGGLYGGGTVFQLTPSNGNWTESVLHSFGAGADGSDPTGSLILDTSGNLYGTTVSGGGSGKSGVVFEVTP